MNTYESRSKAKTITAVISIVAIVGIVILIEALQGAAKSTAQTGSTTASQSGTSQSTATTSPSTTSQSSTTGTYKDGTYTADESYYVPHGSEDITVTLTVANGVVTDSSIVNSESDHDSARYQEEFAAEYKTSVVGKNLSGLKLSYIAGASDTTDGFNTALDAIRTQAQA